MRPTSVTVSSATSSAWIPVDYTQNNFNVGIFISMTGTATWSVQVTSDNIFDPTVTPVAIAALSPLDTNTTNEIGSITTPVRAIRLNVSAWTSGDVVMTVVQGRK